MNVLITQSNYIPWKGYFDAIARADIFVLYDQMQYTKRDWRNRNKIKTANGLQWLSVPVKVKGKYHQKINETEINGHEWQQKHWNTLRHNYKKAPYFDEYAPILEKLYLEESYSNLSQLNYTFIKQICAWLGIDTKIHLSKELEFNGNQTEKLLAICKHFNAVEYISGPAAQNYMETKLFSEAGIHIHWMDYSLYPVYPQLHGEFEHGVTVLDLLLNVGSDAINHLKNAR